ncbi:hypothetical protein BKA67DRAFT_523286 [Truncatella angustata]|uniref:Fungal-specific transcription factor domain-containing protein n=1 Tax=Truncatella angustata TaxID=152316 RepID=A0A9P8UDE7_9PEZI|nr:uncharacterized protein BKA67DRAFT_523286 [Truncatella angustata]KAH6647334.1 hypothetical protein BKA67DRAFT_523286 [Truncatella angustata]
MGTALQFISQDAHGIGSSDRRIIRSHVMRGKTAGKPHHSTRKGVPSIHVRRIITGTSSSGFSKSRQLLWNDLCLTTFPQQLDSESTKLMHRWFFDISDALFPPQFCSKFDMVKSIWVNCILADKAYFHCTLAISASYINFLERESRLSLQTFHHISKAYELVNLKLSGPGSISDSAIAAVICLVIYQQIHNQLTVGLIHLQGLYRMIQLRGGVVELMQHNRMLALKALRLDVELALQNGSTLFKSDEVALCMTSSDFHGPKEQSLGATPKLSDIMLNVVEFASDLNDRSRKGHRKLEPMKFTETLISLLYRLMEGAPLRRPNSVPGELSGKMTHLAMLAFLTSLLPVYVHDCSSYPLLSDCLQYTIQGFHSNYLDTETSGTLLILWSLFISGVSVLKYGKHNCLLLSISKCCERLGISDWPTVRRKLSRFPWIYTLHDIPGKRLWEAAQKEVLGIPGSLKEVAS